MHIGSQVLQETTLDRGACTAQRCLAVMLTVGAAELCMCMVAVRLVSYPRLTARRLCLELVMSPKTVPICCNHCLSPLSPCVSGIAGSAGTSTCAQ